MTGLLKGRMARLSRSLDGNLQDAPLPGRKPVLRRLAHHHPFRRPERGSARHARPDVVDLFAHHPDEAAFLLRLIRQPEYRFDHRKQHTLRVAGAAAVQRLAPQRSRNVGRHRIYMGAEGDARAGRTPHPEVPAVLRDLLPLHLPAKPYKQLLKVAEIGRLAPRRTLDVHQLRQQFKPNLHNVFYLAESASRSASGPLLIAGCRFNASARSGSSHHSAPSSTRLRASSRSANPHRQAKAPRSSAGV